MPSPWQAVELAQVIKRYRKDMSPRLSRTWFYAPAVYQKALQLFRTQPDFFYQGEIIWQMKDRCVRKVTLPDDCGGITLAFKQYEGNKPLRYAFHPAKTTVEATNLLLFADLGLPMVELAFVGDSRTCFHLNRSFIATKFVENSRDGRDFTPEGTCPESPRRQAFIAKVLEGLALLHTKHCFHRGAHVYNFLWTPKGEKDVTLTWIDVASCRFKKLREEQFTPLLVRDLADFFRDLTVAPADMNTYLTQYKQLNPQCLMPTDKLAREVLQLARQLSAERQKSNMTQNTAR